MVLRSEWLCAVLCPVLISTEAIQGFRAEIRMQLNHCGYLRGTANLTSDVILEPNSSGRAARCLRSHYLWRSNDRDSRVSWSKMFPDTYRETIRIHLLSYAVSGVQWMRAEELGFESSPGFLSSVLKGKTLFPFFWWEKCQKRLPSLAQKETKKEA